MALPVFLPKLEVKIEPHDNCGPQEYIKPDLLTVKQENLTGSFLSTDLQTPIYSLVPTIKVEPEFESFVEEVNRSEFVVGGSRFEDVSSEMNLIETEREFRETTIFCEAGSAVADSREYLVPPVHDAPVPNFLAYKVADRMTGRNSVAPGVVSKHPSKKFTVSRPARAPRLKKSSNEIENGSLRRETILSESSAMSRNITLPSLESLIEDTIISALRSDGSTEVIGGSCDALILPVSSSPTYNISSFSGSGQQQAAWNTEAETFMSRRHSSSFSNPIDKKRGVASSNAWPHITQPMAKPVKATVSVSAVLEKSLQARQTSKRIKTSYASCNHCVGKQPGTRSSPTLQERQIFKTRDSPNTSNPTMANQFFSQQITGQSFRPTPESSSVLNNNNEYYRIDSRCSSHVTENHLKHSGQILGTTERNPPTTTCSLDSLILSTIIRSLNCDETTSNIAVSGRTSSEVPKSNFPNISDRVAMKYYSPKEVNGMQFIERVPELVRDSVIILKPTRMDHSTAKLKPESELTRKALLPSKEMLKAAENSLQKPTPILENVISNATSPSKNCHENFNEVVCSNFSISNQPLHQFPNTVNLISSQNTKTSDLHFGEGMSEFSKGSSQITTKQTFGPKADCSKQSEIHIMPYHSVHSNPSSCTQQLLQSTKNFVSACTLGDSTKVVDQAKIDAQGSEEMPGTNLEIETIDISEDSTEPSGEESSSTSSTLGDSTKVVDQEKIDAQCSEEMPGTNLEIETIDISEDSTEPSGGESSSTSSCIPKPIVLTKKVLPDKSEVSVELNQRRREKNKLSTRDNVEDEKEERARLGILSILNQFSEGSLSEKERAKVTVTKVKLFSSPQSVEQTSRSDEFHFIKNRGWACNRCGRLYISRSVLRNHKMHKHYLLDKFICSQCQEIFHSQVSWSNHHKTCGKPVYKCPKCSKFYPSILLYERHYMYHHENTYICLDCSPPKDFKSKGHLISHMSRIHVDVYIPCEACGKVLRNSHMGKHLRMHDRKKLQCLHCGKHFTALATLRTHWKTHRKSGNAAYMCKFCGRFFKLKPDLVRHLKEHGDERNFVCDHCGKGFFRRDHLIYHLKIHGEEKFICAHCDQGFFYKHQVTEHLSSGACSINAMPFSKRVKKAKK